MERKKASLGQTVVWWVLLAVGLVACAPAAQPAPAAPVKPGGAAEEQPQPGGTMMYPGLAAPRNQDYLTGAGPSEVRGMGGNYDSLVTYDYLSGDDYRIDYKIATEGLAERWERSPDGKTFTFSLRKGVKWHDGQDFTAADVLHTIQRLIKEKGRLYASVKDIMSVEAPDPYTVKVVTGAPNVDFLIGLSSPNLAIVPKHVADQGKNVNEVTIGTGPYKLESFDNKTKNVWVKNQDYWNKGKPYMDRVEIVWGLDKPAMLAAFATSKVDVTWTVNKTDYDTVFKTKPDVVALKQAFGQDQGLYFNMSKPPFSDARVRKAMHLAVNRQELIKVNGFGEGYLNCVIPGGKVGWCPPDDEMTKLPGWRQPKDQDIAEAKKLLADAGYPNGFEFRAMYSTQYTQTPPLAELFATQMARIGLKANIDPKDTASYRDAELKGNYESIFVVTGSMEMGERLFDYFHTKGTLNAFKIGNPELDKLIEQQGQAFNIEERKKLIRQIFRIIVDQPWVITWTDNVQYSLVQPWVKGKVLGSVRYQSPPSPLVANTWLDQKLLPKR